MQCLKSYADIPGMVSDWISGTLSHWSILLDSFSAAISVFDVQ